MEKNAGILKSYFTEGGDNVSSNYILGTIEDAGAGEKAITTYDNLILELVGIDKTIAADKVDRQFLEDDPDGLSERVLWRNQRKSIPKWSK